MTFNRYNFFTARQTDIETFEFYTRLRKLSENFDFAELRDSLIKDIVIIGIRDTKLKERFLRENDIDLQTVLKNGRACEASKKHQHFMGKTSSCSSGKFPSKPPMFWWHIFNPFFSKKFSKSFLFFTSISVYVNNRPHHCYFWFWPPYLLSETLQVKAFMN